MYSTVQYCREKAFYYFIDYYLVDVLFRYHNASTVQHIF
jgi:hypothetical protein